MSGNFSVAELNKLKNIQHGLESTQAQLIQNLCKYDPNLQEFIQRTKDESKTEIDLSYGKIINLHNQLQTITNNIKDKTSECDALKLKQSLISVKDNIGTFQAAAKCNLSELRAEEKNLAEELKMLEQKFDAYAKPVEIEEPTLTKRSALNQIDCAEVKTFDKFLKDSNGHTQGWTVEDHAMFLKIKNKYRNIDTIAAKLNHIFPDKTIDDIKQHYTWHEKYIELKQKQKEAISKWKAKRQAFVVDRSVNTLPNMELQNDIKLEKRKKLEKSKSAVSFTTEETKARLSAWKEEKKQREEREALVREMNEQFRRQLEIMKIQKKNEMKEQVDRWRTLKTIAKLNAERTRREEEMKTRAFKAMLANHFIKDFQVQDMQFVNKMQTFRDKKTSSSSGASSGKQSTKKPTPVPRDPSRLLKPTKTWILKTAKHEKESLMHLGSCNLNLNSIQKLKAPDWRK